MVTVSPVKTSGKQLSTPDYGKEIYQWTPMADGDTLLPLITNGPGVLAGSIQFSGTFGGTCKLQGSNDGTNWVDLKDTGGNAISTAAAAAFELSTGMSMVRPTAGTGVASVTATLCMRG